MLKKQYDKSGKKCKVTFYTDAELQAETVHLVGDFNDWNEQSHPMEALKDGRFKLVVSLEAGREYQFRYLVNGTIWHNDWHADKYAPNPYNGDNSVVVV